MRGQVVKDKGLQILVHAVSISILLFVALYLATRYGLIHCSQVPYWCDGYIWLRQTISGRTYPQILLLHGDSGMGDPQALADFIDQRCNIYVYTDDIDSVTLGNLGPYDVVIVEKARDLSAEQMKMLWDFAAKGGKLVVIGDVGAELAKNDDYVYVEEFNDDTNSFEKRIYNYWDRHGDAVSDVLFGTRLLGLELVGNYCKSDDCTVHGTIRFRRDYVTKNLPPSAPFPINFTVVRPLGGSVFGPAVTVATIEGVGSVGDAEPPYTAIYRVGYRVLYYAFPPEELWKEFSREEGGKSSFPASRLIYNLCSWAST